MEQSNNHRDARTEQCRIISLDRKCHPYGALTVAQNNGKLPFLIRRVFYIHDIPAGSVRGGHSHHHEQQLIIAACGCFDVTVTDGTTERTFTLRRPDEALYIPAGIWRILHDFSSGSVCLTLSSTKFDENDYVRCYADFLKLKKTTGRS